MNELVILFQRNKHDIKRQKRVPFSFFRGEIKCQESIYALPVRIVYTYP